MDALLTIGINVQSIIIYILLFIALYLVVNKYFLKNIFKTLDARREEIDKGLKYSVDAQKQKELAQKEYDDLIGKAKSESKTILEDSRARAEIERNETLEKAKTEAASIVESAKAKFDQYKRDYTKTVEAEIEKRARQLVHDVIGEDVDLDKKTISNYISKI